MRRPPPAARGAVLYRWLSALRRQVHASGLLHNTVIRDPSFFIEPNPMLGSYLKRLRDNNKAVSAPVSWRTA